MFAFILGLAIGAAIGILVYRNNKAKSDAIIANLQAQLAKGVK